MSWWRQNWRWMLGGLAVLAGGLLLMLLYILRKKEEAEELRAQLALMQAANKVAGLKADKQARKLDLMRNKDEAKKLDKEIADARRKAVAVVQDVENMDDIEVAMELRKLGY